MLGDLANWVQDVINQFGYFGVALLVIIENMFPPIPSEIVLPFAGFVAQQGASAVNAAADAAQSDTTVVGMMIAATVGSVVGALILYFVSAAIGPERLRAFVERFGKWFGVKSADLVRAEAMVHAMDDQFGSCTNHGECSAACPKEISLDVIALMNSDFRKSKSKNRKALSRG